MKTLYESILDMNDDAMDKGTDAIVNYEWEQKIHPLIKKSNNQLAKADFDAKTGKIDIYEPAELFAFKYSDKDSRFTTLGVKKIDAHTFGLMYVDPLDIPLIHNAGSIQICDRSYKKKQTINIEESQKISGVSFAMPFNGTLDEVVGDIQLSKATGWAETRIAFHTPLNRKSSLKRLYSNADILDVRGSGAYYEGQITTAIKPYQLNNEHRRPTGKYEHIPNSVIDQFINTKKWPELHTIYVNRYVTLYKTIRNEWKSTAV